jgi:hypothetical protein
VFTEHCKCVTFNGGGEIQQDAVYPFTVKRAVIATHCPSQSLIFLEAFANRLLQMASNGTTLLSGQSAPLASITSTDERGIVLIATSLGLAFALISLVIRIFIRIDFHQAFARDDVAAVASMVS